MRAYFAYRLQEPIKVRDEAGKEYEAHYRLGISSTQRGGWREGLPVSEKSNVHRVYSQVKERFIPDTDKPEAHPNQKVTGERSVFSVPVIYKNGVVGVLGISSPHVNGVKPFQDFAREVGIVFASLFFAYGQYLMEYEECDNPLERIRDDLAADLGRHFRMRGPDG